MNVINTIMAVLGSHIRYNSITKLPLPTDAALHHPVSRPNIITRIIHFKGTYYTRYTRNTQWVLVYYTYYLMR